MLSDNLKRLRASKGVSQYDISRALGVSQPTIAGWERGRTEPPAEMIKRLAQYFCVSTDFLLDKTPPDEFDSETVNMLKDYRMLDAANRQMISRLVSALWAQQQAAPA